MDDLAAALRDYLDFDDPPTTPGDMMWVDCDCTKHPRFQPAQCDVCFGVGKKLTTVPRTNAPVEHRQVVAIVDK